MSTPPRSLAARRLRRPYVRKLTNNALGIQPPSSPPQIARLAFNIHGWAMEDGMTWRGTFEAINAYKATMVKGGFEAKIEELGRENQSKVYRDDLTYTARELDSKLVNTDSAVAQYLVVGYTLQEDDPVFQANKTFARYSDNELVGETEPDTGNLVRWGTVRTPILVVTPIKENIGTSVRLFALIMPRSGLCQPVLITHERIFYRWEFRASAGARPAQRNKNWNQVVIDKARELTPPGSLIASDISLETASAQHQMKRRRSSTIPIKQEDDYDYLLTETQDDLNDDDVFELMLDLNELFKAMTHGFEPMEIPAPAPNITSRLKIVLNDESRGVLHAIINSVSARIQQQVQDSFFRIATANRTPTDQHPGLLRFGSPDTDFGKDEAEVVVADIKRLWPKLSHVVDVKIVLRIKHVLDSSKLVVNLEVMKEFFSSALPFVKIRGNISDEALRDKLHELIQTAAALTQSITLGQVDPNIGMDAVWLVTLLKDILVAHDWQSRGTSSMLGESVPETFSDMVVQYRINVQELNSAMNNMANSIQQIITIAQRNGCGVQDILLWLERLRLRIRQASRVSKEFS